MHISDKKKIKAIFITHPEAKRLYYAGGRFYLSYGEAKKHGDVEYIDRSDFINETKKSE